MNYTIVINLITATLLGMNLGIFVYKREYNLIFYLYLALTIAYILFIAKFR